MGRETVYLCYDFRRFSKAGDDRNVNESRIPKVPSNRLACTHSLCVCVLGGGGGGGGGGHYNRKGGGGGVWGKSIATGLGREPVGGCYSAEMRRPAIRSTAHYPILSYPTYQPPIQDVSLQISVPNCVPLRGYTTSPPHTFTTTQSLLTTNTCVWVVKDYPVKKGVSRPDGCSGGGI